MNHFGKGLMAGLSASQAASAQHAARFCHDYKRGFVLGYTYRLYENTGDRLLSAWEAGLLTRRYALDKDAVIDFFTESQASSSRRFFMAGYRLGGQTVSVTDAGEP
ncbi:DUF2623 family protein [Atlantibacter hermannii]|uniref:DUF2623 family protein n=2 Tax=Atlantibacter hermannii TaxID=565 RepID=UPI0011CECC33|nr:DUF2623 family protein [Atlantibacter hermannii]MBW9429488.1 DUF2623 family protein [Atlantibacter hermannii]MDU1950132.1 DUF2623 family protein [Atlantibacter hermannii]MDW4576662.1 DUF2623 family protein [Atlantibacter hermannii]